MATTDEILIAARDALDALNNELDYDVFEESNFSASDFLEAFDTVYYRLQKAIDTREDKRRNEPLALTQSEAQRLNLALGGHENDFCGYCKTAVDEFTQRVREKGW